MPGAVIDPIAASRIIEAVIPSIRITIAAIAIVIVIIAAITDRDAAIAIAIVIAAGQCQRGGERQPEPPLLVTNIHCRLRTQSPCTSR
jgi:hypothetical protein